MKNKVFIGGLNYQTTEESLKEELTKYGKVIAIRVVTERESGKSKGFGFATFETEAQANLAIEGLNNQIFEGRRIGVKPNIEKK